MTQEGGCDRQGLVHAGQAHKAGAQPSVHAQQRRCARSSARDLVLVRMRQVFNGPRSRPGFSVTTWLRLGPVGPRSQHKFCVKTSAGLAYRQGRLLHKVGPHFIVGSFLK